MIGIFIGGGLFGRLSDLIGRKPTVTIGLLIGAVAQVLCGFAYSYESYVFFRTLSALGKTLDGCQQSYQAMILF